MAESIAVTNRHTPRAEDNNHNRIPRDHKDDYTNELAESRRTFVTDKTNADLGPLASYPFDPAVVRGNIEQFIGTAQVPIGIAGPLRINGEHAQGDFYIPLATTEGTLVASYNRGMQLLTAAGGIKTTVVADSMQRAPVFALRDAMQARDFGSWLEEHFVQIKQVADATTRAGKLQNID